MGILFYFVSYIYFSLKARPPPSIILSYYFEYLSTPVILYYYAKKLDAMALQQPDFHSVRTKLQEVGNEIALCVNLPAVDGGQQVLGLLREMREEMRGLRADVAQLREDMQQHEVRNAARQVLLSTVES